VLAARSLSQHLGVGVDMVAVYAPSIPMPATPNRPGLRQCEGPERDAAALLLRAVRAQRRQVLGDREERQQWPVRLEVGDPGATIVRLASDSAPALVVLGIGHSEPLHRRSTHLSLGTARYLTVPLYAAMGDGAVPTRCGIAFPDGRPHQPTIRTALACVARGAAVWLLMPAAGSKRGAGDVEPGTAGEIFARACDRELLDKLQSIMLERVDADDDMLTAVLRTAEQVDAQLIAVPNQGPPGAVRIFLPNLAEPLLLSARCSVLVVPDSVESHPT
jgi:nucleotide-binding universal stress UspA family protein